MISEVSRRYAKALYENSKATKTTDKVFAELRVLAESIKTDATVREYFSSPLVTPDQKINALENALTGKLSEEVLNFLLLLAEKNRLEVFSDILLAYEQISDEDHGVTRGTVRSATALTPDAQSRIEEIVNTVTKRKVILNFTVDPKILGGMVAQVGGWTFDDSLESHLTRLNEELKRSAH
jgi:F-type H+-transporting ATPase subunit delta